MSWARDTKGISRQRPADICPGLSDQASTQTHADDGCGGGHKYDRTVLQHEEHFCCYIVSEIQAPNKHHLLLTIGDYISLGTWGNCRISKASLCCWDVFALRSGEVYGWWGAECSEYKLEYCAAPGDISDRFAAPRLYPHCTLGAGLHCLTYISNYHLNLSLGHIYPHIHIKYPGLSFGSGAKLINILTQFRTINCSN